MPYKTQSANTVFQAKPWALLLIFAINFEAY
ncbi:MAG: hypothetical protein ACI9NN_001247, partial [Bacteroidia bacterium]